MKAIRLCAVFILLMMCAGLQAQLVQPMPAYILTKDDNLNRTTLFIPDSNQLMVFEKNEFSIYTKEGRLLSGPYTLRNDDGDIWYPRISGSGKMIAMYVPGKGFIEDNYMALYNRDSGYLVGRYKMQYQASLQRARFSGDSVFYYYTQNEVYKDIYTWHIQSARVSNAFIKEDTVHAGVYDLAHYKGKAVGVVRSEDSLSLVIFSDGKQYFQMFKLSSATVKNEAQFSTGYPYAIIGDESIGQTRFFKMLDTSFQLVSTLKKLPVIYAAAATEDACYILYKDSTQKNNPVLKIFNTKTNAEITISGLPLNGEEYIFSVYPEQGIFTASHITYGNIIAFSLADGKQAWMSSPKPPIQETTTGEKSIHEENKLFKVLIKQGSKDVSKTYYNEEANQLYLVKNNETLITVDADAKCAVRWEPFYKDDNRITDAVLMPGYRYIVYTEERWKLDESKEKNKMDEIDVNKNRYSHHYPYTYKIFDRQKGKLVFNLQTKEETGINFINDSLIYWSASTYLSTNDSITIYNLNTGVEKNVHPFTSTDAESYAVNAVGNKLYYFFVSDKKLLLTNESGKKIFSRSYFGESDNANKIIFVNNSPYFYFNSTAKNAASQLYKIQGDSTILIRKLPADITVRTTKANDKGCYFIYTKEYNRKTGIVLHNRVINMVTGQDKLIDSIRYEEAGNDRGVYEIFPDKNFYTKTNGGVVTWHDLNTGYAFKDFGRDETSIVSLAYSPEGRYLAASSTGKVLLWDLGTGKETKSLAVESNGYITKLAFSGDGKYLAASSGDIWETASGKNVVSVTDGRIWAVNSIDFSPDGKRIISGGVCIISWDAEDGSKMYFQQQPRPEDMDKSGTCWNPNGCINPEYGFMVYSTAFHPNSRDFVTGNRSGIIQKWNTENSKQGAYAFLGEIGEGTDIKIADLKYTRDGDHIIAVQQKLIYKLNAATLAIEDSLFLPEGDEIFGIDMGYDGNLFGCITSRNNGRIVQIRNISDLKVKQEFYTDGNSFNKISFSPNKKHAATASDDGFCTIWDLATGKPAMYLNTIGDYGNIMVTPENYYMASKSALEGVTFFKDSSFYSFDQFDLYLNRPDIVLARLGYASPELVNFYRNAFFKRLKKATGNTNDTAVNNYTPSLRLVNKKTIPLVSSKAMTALSFDVEDNSVQKGVLQVFINGNLIKEHHFTEAGSAILNYTDSVALGQGINNIEAVYKTTSSIESRKEKIAVTYSPAKSIPSRVWFVGVGISKYKDADMNLKYPVKDIKDLVTGFKKKYPGLIIDTLLNEKATKENIIALREKLKNTSINDKVIVSFNGHGLLSDSLDWYFATYDVDFKKPEANGLSYTMMEGILDGIPARQKLLLMDACHSGEVDKESDITIENAVSPMDSSVITTARGLIKKGDSKVGLQTSFELMQDLFANLSNGNGTTVLSAAGGKEYALESDKWKNGVFTYSVLKALRDPATDENLNNKISVKELKKAVFAAVKTLTGGRQKPTSRVEVMDDWEVW